ncbi:helix-turn-helix domain-containing protein [Bradyrhizobium sp. DASA03005]|uniref:helix-turn-helix domain-containing protein n=1 Tax=Bradyrhizobium sp. SPXBL-02 TaxID=3395912 RepID=UPI003F6F41E0
MSLPISERDFADYLTLTVETVSCAVSQLHSDGVLELQRQYSTRVMVLGRQRLARSGLQS